jgi:hypothetical protein
VTYSVPGGEGIHASGEAVRGLVGFGIEYRLTYLPTHQLTFSNVLESLYYQIPESGQGEKGEGGKQTRIIIQGVDETDLSKKNRNVGQEG